MEHHVVIDILCGDGTAVAETSGINDETDSSMERQLRRRGLSYLTNWPVGLQEIRLKECIKQVSRNPFNGVVDGEHVDALAILNVSALPHKKAGHKRGEFVVATEWAMGATSQQPCLQAPGSLQ